MTKDEIEVIFKPLGEGKTDEFFENVADDVEWSVMGTHPLAGVYYSKEEFLGAIFGRLSKLLDHPVSFHYRDAIVEGDQAAVELYTKDVAKSGVRFEMSVCWVCRFREDKIVEVHAYPDSALLTEIVEIGEHRMRKHRHPGKRELGKPAPRVAGRAIAHQ